MSLTIVYKSNGESKIVTMHSPFSETDVRCIASIKVLSVKSVPVEKVYADGQELDYINQRFINLPSAHRHCIWHGEMAQFIVNNLL